MSNGQPTGASTSSPMNPRALAWQPPAHWPHTTGQQAARRVEPSERLRDRRGCDSETLALGRPLAEHESSQVLRNLARPSLSRGVVEGMAPNAQRILTVLEHALTAPDRPCSLGALTESADRDRRTGTRARLARVPAPAPRSRTSHGRSASLARPRIVATASSRAPPHDRKSLARAVPRRPAPH